MAFSCKNVPQSQKASLAAHVETIPSGTWGQEHWQKEEELSCTRNLEHFCVAQNEAVEREQWQHTQNHCR